MAVRSTMSAIIARVRLMISDSGGTEQFTDQQIQDTLDESRNDIRYEGELIAPSLVNVGNTQNGAQTIFADYYSAYQWWESDVVLQGNGPTGLPWVVLTPYFADCLTGHWQFEADVFNSPSVPGQLPPIFATGKVYDLYAASASLLEMWAAVMIGRFDVTVNGQTMRRSQIAANMLTMANRYWLRAKPVVGKLKRSDVMPNLSTRRMRLLDSDDVVKGA